MRYLLVFGLLLTGCANKNVNATLFLREKDQTLNNLKGDACLESGQQIIKATDGETYRMIHFYSNCDVHLNRKLEEFELKQWIVPVK